MVEVTSTTRPRRSACTRKGNDRPSSDADIVIYDPLPPRRSPLPRPHGVDYSCYEGKTVTGHVDTVMSRGRVIIEAGTSRVLPVTAVLRAKSVSTSAELRRKQTWTSASSCKTIHRLATSSR